MTTRRIVIDAIWHDWNAGDDDLDALFYRAARMTVSDRASRAFQHAFRGELAGINTLLDPYLRREG
jgi:hypothetical protein